MRSPGSSRPGRAAGERSCVQPKNGRAVAEERSQLRREIIRKCSHGEGGGLRSSAKSVINNLGSSGYARRMKSTLFLSLILCASVFAAPSQKAVREHVDGELPWLHSAQFASDTACLKIGVTAMTAAGLELVGKK